MFCSKCGTQVADGAAFCPTCGTPTGASTQSQAPAQPQMTMPAAPMGVPGRLHCPHCRSYNLSITTESSVNGALTTNTGNISTTSVSNTHRNFWFCNDCGTKFRNIQSLEEEIEKNKNNPRTMIIVCIISSILTLLAILYMASAEYMLFLAPALLIFPLVFAIVSFVFIFVYKNRLTKMREELAYLQQNCFN